MIPSKSYHDVTVIVDDVEYNLFNSSYGLILTCNRVSGWQLWFNIRTPEERLIGGEYNNNKFKIKFGDNIVFDNSI